MSTSEERRRAASAKLEESMLEQERRKEEIKFKEEWNKRIEIAREGRLSYENEDPGTSIVNYKKILTLTSRYHKVSIDKLHPKLFDEKTRVHEALLISAITFDLAKIIDRFEGETAKKELAIYLRLFVLFSKGQPFEVIALSTIRKHLLFSHGIRHKQLFNSAFNELKRGSCFIATVAFADPYCEEILMLRIYRDKILAKRFSGRIFIRVYYILGPWIAKAIQFTPGMRRLTKVFLRLWIRKFIQSTLQYETV